MSYTKFSKEVTKWLKDNGLPCYGTANDSPEETKARLDAWMHGSKEILRQWITEKRYRELISCAHGGWYQDDVIFEPLAEHFVANHLFDELRFLCERGIRFSAEDMLATIKSEKEEHGTLDIETIRSNYGWDEPLGACGLIAWTSEGTPLWKNENYSIYDCYAISLDEEENLWFYYYDEFRLVRTNFKEDFVFELPIEGSGAFSVAPSGNTFLFQGGYQQRDKFYFLTAHGDHLGKKQEAIPTCDGNKVAVEQCSLLRSRMLFLGKDGVLYGGIWGSDGQ